MVALGSLDYTIVFLLSLLALVPPLLIGSVNPGAYSILERAIFLMVVLWMARAFVFGGPLLREGALSALRVFAFPMAVLIAILALQLVPLPPQILRILSPPTYRTYVETLPGWPHAAAYHDVNLRVAPRVPKGAVVLPTVNEVRAGAAIPFAPPKAAPVPSGPPAAKARHSGHRWRSISFEPAVAAAGVLKAVAYAALFIVIVLYPFGWDDDPGAELRFYRILLGTVVLSGFIIAALGLLNWASWNGKVLWFYVPRDWGVPQVDIVPRARGPFVDPDHFANYLAMILPLVVAGGMFRSDLVPRRWRGAVGFVCAAVGFTMTCAILLSLSRAGWIAGAVGLATLAAMLVGVPEERRERFAPRLSGRTMRLAAAGFALMVVAALVIVGPVGRGLTDVRLRQAVMGSEFSERYTMWRDSLGMIRDFPAFGVGLGCWGELFTRYVKPPWSPWYFFREAHDDYIQFAAETGAIGLAAFGWLAFVLIRAMRRGQRTQDPKRWPMLAAVLASVAVAGFHELFDFSLHMPANAIMLTILVAVGVRMATTIGDIVADEPATRRSREAALIIAGAAVVLIVAASGQHDTAYPYYLKTAHDAPGALRHVIRHPADSDGHFTLAKLGQDLMSRDAWAREIGISVWLDPTNPYKRDLYVETLLQRAMAKEGMRELTVSVYNSPEPDTHYYLSRRFVGWLTPAARAAVEKGFAQAIAQRLRGAFEGLADYYEQSGNYAAEAELYARAAATETDPNKRIGLMLNAGKAYATARMPHHAIATYHLAIKAAPGDIRAYEGLAENVYGPANNMAAARKTIEAAIADGGDPYVLYLSLADAAVAAKNPEAEAIALNLALKEQPEGFEVLTRLGDFYMDSGNYDRAILNFQQAADTNPDSADTFFKLGIADESDFRYYDADKAFAEAVALDPQNEVVRGYYTAFKQHMAKESIGSQTDPAPSASQPSDSQSPDNPSPDSQSPDSNPQGDTSP